MGILFLPVKRFLFAKAPLPVPEAGNIVDEVWDGHCWLEFGGLVADASFFRTVYFGEVPSQFKDMVIKKFGEGNGTVIATPEQMQFNELTYIPKFSLSTIQFDGLVSARSSFLSY